MSELVLEKDTSRAVVDTSVKRVTGLDFTQTKDFLAVEEPLEIEKAHGPADARAMSPSQLRCELLATDLEGSYLVIAVRGDRACASVDPAASNDCGCLLHQCLALSDRFNK